MRAPRNGRAALAVTAQPRPAEPRDLPASMQAAVIGRHGEPPEHASRPVPRRGPGEALIRVTAAPVNPLDLLCASGTSYFGPPPLPYVPGAQGVGVIEEAGRWPAGQRVWFSCDAGMRPGDGAMAQWCVAAEESIQPLPDGVSDDLAAALGLSAIAAWTALSWRAGLQPGEHVLVLGASGTVGQVGVQAARLLGADAVADLTGDDAAAIGRRLAEATAGRADVVLDPVWGRPAEAAAGVLSPGGRLVNLGSAAGAEASLGSAVLRGGTLAILGYTNNALSHEQKAAALAGILDHAAAGRLTADRETLPLASAAEAWSRCGQAPHRRAVLIP